MKKNNDEYYLYKTIKHDNATIHVYRPILTEEERKKREKHLADVASRMLSNYYARKAREAAESQQSED